MKITRKIIYRLARFAEKLGSGTVKSSSFSLRMQPCTT
jgi:hypothetical protein